MRGRREARLSATLMRVVIAIHHFPPAFTAGSEQHAFRIAGELRRRGHTVRIFCVERIDHGPANDLTWRDDVYEGLPVRRVSFNLRAAPDPRRWEYDNPWIGTHLAALLRSDRPDVLHLFSGYLLTGRALRTAHDLGIPTVVTVTDFWFLCPRITMLRSDGTLSRSPIDPLSCARCLGEEQRRFRVPSRFAPGLMTWFWRHQHRRIESMRRRQSFLCETLQQVGALLSPSEFLRTMLIQHGVSPARITVCRQGIDVPTDLRLDAPHPHQLPLRVGFTGQLNEQKGVHLLIAAVRRLPAAPILLRIYGDREPFPAYVATLERVAAGDRRIEFAGQYSGPTERRQVLEELDVSVVPSVWYENNPMAINEALGHGVPVIATDLGSIPETVIHGRNGLLFRRGDVDGLTQLLQRLIDERDLLATLRAGITPRPTVGDETTRVEQVYASVRAQADASGAPP